MTLNEFVQQVPDFHSLTQNEKIVAFVWYLHSYRREERVSNQVVRQCFDDAHFNAPDLSVYLPRLADRKKGVLLKDAGGYRLSATARADLDARYGEMRSALPVTRLLTGLPAQMPTVEKREFLEEALRCYQARAFRAAIVMTWNLTYFHALDWVVGDATRLADFNAAIPRKYPNRRQRVVHPVDFEEFKESEVLEVLRTARKELKISKSVLDILDEKLKNRNAAAHPSPVRFHQPQADAIITDLINNVLLHLVRAAELTGTPP